MESSAEIGLQEHVEVWPVVVTGERWPAIRETQTPHELFQRFPQCRDDPRRCDLGGTPAFPEPFSRGGGLFPVLLLLDDGTLACVVRTGAPHRGSGGEVSICFSQDRGGTWSDYRVIVRGDPRKLVDRRNHAIGQAANGDLVLAYGEIPGWDPEGRRADKKHHAMKVTRSRDGGNTWSKAEVIESPPRLCVTPYGQMRRLGEGRLVFNARGYYKPEEYARNSRLPKRMTYLYWSDDDGYTWVKRTLIRRGKTETGFAPLDRQHWIGFVRHMNNPSMIAHSYDGARTWVKWASVPGRTAETRARRHPGSVAKLPNGLVLATYGHREYPFGVRAIVSRDGGETFDLTREYVLADSYLHYDCGYPSTVSFPDGTIVTVAYTIQDLEHPQWGTACIAYRYHQSLLAGRTPQSGGARPHSVEGRHPQSPPHGIVSETSLAQPGDPGLPSPACRPSSGEHPNRRAER